MLIRVMGDPHGHLDLEEDLFWMSRADVAMCTGDFDYHIQGRGRSESMLVMQAFNRAGIFTMLGNHDGVCHRPALNYAFGEIEPAVQKQLIEELGDFFMGYRRIDFDDFSLVGARPFSNGNPGIQHPPFGHESITVEESAEKISGLIAASPNSNILILSHNGPKGLGEGHDAPYGRDWKKPHEDWGDEDLELVLRDRPHGKQIMAVVTGHMHHKLRGSGYRQRLSYFDDVPVINAAVVPRVHNKGLVVTRQISGELIEKKIMQEHRHFLDLTFEQGRLVGARDFWARKGSRRGDGIKMSLGDLNCV